MNQTDRLPRWAQRLKERHPEADLPSRSNPIPPWLEEEATRIPLWYTIREAPETRSAHPFLLFDEIQRQPEQWSDIVDRYGTQVDALADEIVERDVNRIIFTGCGSAFFTAIHGAYTLPRLGGVESSPVESFELANYFPPTIDPRRTLVVGHSGTGGSIETVEAMEAAAQRGCLTLAITNTEDTAVERASALALTYVTRQACGPCISVVSTRVLLQTMLAVALGRRLGGDERQLDAVAEALGQISAAGTEFLAAEEARIREFARRFRSASSFFLVGSGPNYFSAREGTLKIEEQAIVVAKAYRTGDFHHDALSLLDPERVVIAIEAGEPANPRMVDVLRAAREGGAPTVAVGWSGTGVEDELADHADHWLHLPGKLPEEVVPIPLTLAFQLLGYYLGVERGYNPDTLRTDHLPNARAWLTSFPLGTH